MQTESHSTRHSIDDLGNMLKITIPSQKLWQQIFLTGLGVVSIVSLVVIMWGYLIRGEGFGEATPFISVCLAISTIYSVYAIYNLLWRLFGNEVIQVSSHGIIITSRSVFGFGFPKKYSSEQIGFLRVSSPLSSKDTLGQSQVSRFEGMVSGLIMFDYDEKTVKFGSGIDEAEAKQILSEIYQRYPQYRTRAHVG